MRPRLGRIFVACLIAILSSTICLAQVIDDAGEVVSLYAKGRRLAREGDWFRALQVFRQLEGRYANSKNLDVFVFHRAKAHYYLGEYSEAIAGFSYFITHFPHSPEVPYAHFFLGNANYRRASVSPAVSSYIESYRLSLDKRLDALLMASLEAALKSASSIDIGPADFKGFSGDRKCRLVRVIAEAYVARGKIRSANKLLSLCGERVDASVASKVTSRYSSSELGIALVLPFSGEMHSWADDIYNGAIIAAEMYRRESNGRVNLVPCDTRGDPVNAARIVTELSQQPDIHAAIGPLTSEEAAVAAAALSCASLPLIVPAATQAGLTALSNTSFQLSPNIELQGTRMAQYAIDSLGADSAAVITSTSHDHLQMARAFSERFEQLGGTVVGAEYYRSRDKDFGPYIRDLKAMIWGLPPDSIFFVNADGDTLDPDGIPVFVDCLFLPGSPKQLRLLLPQIHFYKLTGFYLGSDGWADDAVYRLGDDVTRGAVFPSPFLTGSYSDEYVSFSAAYDARYGEQPPRLACLGYDCVRLVTRAGIADGFSRERLTPALQKVDSWQGAGGKVTFGKYRENIELPLYRIESGQAVILGPEDIAAEPESE